MNLPQLMEEWEKDSSIPVTSLTRCSAETPLLHAKYLRELITAKSQRRKYEVELTNLFRDKKRYFNGELTRDELTELGWPQYQGIKPLKSEIKEMIEMEPDYINLETKLISADAKVTFLENVIASINSRNWTIKNIIDWERFQNGE